MMENYNIESKAILKKYVQYFLCSVAAIEIVFVFLFLYMGNSLFSFVNAMLAAVNLFLFIYTYHFSFDKIKPLITSYLIFLSFHVYLFVFIYWRHSVVSFIWFLLIPIGISKIFTFRNIVYWSFGLFVLVIITFILPDIFMFRSQFYISEYQMLMINITVIFSVFCLGFLILYFNNKISVLRMSRISAQSQKVIKKYNPGNSEKKEIYMELHRRIILSFDKEEPYLSSEFNIAQLAISLNTNSTYISKAINICTGMNFNAFVNTYRIKKAKDLLNQYDPNKFTLVHVYTMAGFKHQSTFNKVFKQTVGVSPTQYLERV